MSTSKSKQYELLKMTPIEKGRIEDKTKDAGVMWQKETNRYLLGLPPISKPGRISEEEKAERQTNDSQKFRRMKNSIKKALVEMELFLQVSPIEEIDDVFHSKSIVPLIQAMIYPRRIPDPDASTEERIIHKSEKLSDVKRELIGALARGTLEQFKNTHVNLSIADSRVLDEAISTIWSKIDPNYRSPLNGNTSPNI